MFLGGYVCYLFRITIFFFSFWGLVTLNSCLFLSEILAWNGRTKGRKRTQKYFIVNSSRSLFRILFSCRLSLNGIRETSFRTLYTFTHNIYRVKKELGGEVDKSEKGPKWPVELVNRFFLPLHAILCISSYESETKARAEKNLKFPIFHAPAEHERK